MKKIEKKKVLLVVLGEFESSPRSERMLNFLESKYYVSVLASSCHTNLVGQFYKLELQNGGLFSKFYKASLLLRQKFYCYLKQTIQLPPNLNLDYYDSIICYDLILLPVLLGKSPTARIIQDLREYYPEQFGENLFWRVTFGKLANFICENHLVQTTVCWTVSPGLAKKYKATYGVECSLMPSYPNNTMVEKVNKASPRKLKLVHHGVCNPNRELENIIQAMSFVSPSIELHLYLVETNKSYFNKLKNLARHKSNVVFKKTVNRDYLIPSLAEYDVGLFCYPNNSFNLDNAWPNKQFEFIQAGLALIVTPLTGASEVVNTYKNGIIADGYTAEDIAKAINELNNQDKLASFQRASRLAVETCHFKALIPEIISSL